ncbi:MAG: HD domain-containing protein [Erysipelotrichaceae bacterium]|nr:HD domain-containing protein [Erysipelotrichaceae bacterium]
MENLIEKTRIYVKNLMSQESTGHDWWHTQRVCEMALRLAKAEKDPLNEEVIILASTLHDILDYKLSGDEAAGPQAAYDWLSKNNASKDLIDQVVEIISTLSFKGKVHRPMSTREGMIVQDADRLDAVGAIGIARTFAYGGSHHREIFNPELKFRSQLSSEDYKNKDLPTASLNHFYEKLLKLNGNYNTALANEIGKERHEFMKTYLLKFLEEANEEDSDFARELKLY